MDDDDDDDSDVDDEVKEVDEDEEEDEIEGEEVVEADGELDGAFDFEVVGLNMSSNGRECTLHEICGEHLSVGEIVKLVPIKISNANGIQEEALSVNRIMDGIVGCRVGFVPRVQANMLHRRNEFTIKPYAIVKDLYRYSKNEYLQSKSRRNYG
jgi:hypothetical protein